MALYGSGSAVLVPGEDGGELGGECLALARRPKLASAAQMVVGGTVEPPPVEPPPVEPPPPAELVIRLRPSSFEVVVDGKVLGTVRLDFIPAAPSAPSTPAAPKPGGPGR